MAKETGLPTQEPRRELTEISVPEKWKLGNTFMKSAWSGEGKPILRDAMNAQVEAVGELTQRVAALEVKAVAAVSYSFVRLEGKVLDEGREDDNGIAGVKVTFARLLFSADLEHQDDFVTGEPLTDDFKKEFEDRSITLFDDLIIDTQEEGIEWWIIRTDATSPTFIVSRQTEALNIYRGSPVDLYTWWDGRYWYYASKEVGSAPEEKIILEFPAEAHGGDYVLVSEAILEEPFIGDEELIEPPDTVYRKAVGLDGWKADLDEIVEALTDEPIDDWIANWKDYQAAFIGDAIGADRYFLMQHVDKDELLGSIVRLYEYLDSVSIETPSLLDEVVDATADALYAEILPRLRSLFKVASLRVANAPTTESDVNYEDRRDRLEAAVEIAETILNEARAAHGAAENNGPST